MLKLGSNFRGLTTANQISGFLKINQNRNTVFLTDKQIEKLMKKKYNDAYYQGYQARKDDKSRCSYSFGLSDSERAWWLAGWHDADMEEQDEVKRSA